MKRRDFLKFLGAVPFGIKALQQDSEEPETSIEELPRIQPGHITFTVYPDPSSSSFDPGGSSFIVTSASGYI